ncbi:MAG: substrate-binding domain-containing protein, partial [Bdellovibrionales bacterium]
DNVINYLLSQPLHAFRADFPLVIPSVFLGTPDEVIDSLLNTENEFGLVFAKVNTPQIEYHALRDEPMVLVAEANLWRESKGANHTATLNKVLEKVGYLSSIGAHTQVRASRVLRELFGKTPRIGFEVNSQEAQKRICLAGGGIAYLTRFMVENEIKSGQLQEISVEHPHAFKLWLATRKNRPLSLPAKLFVERLKREWGPL